MQSVGQANSQRPQATHFGSPLESDRTQVATPFKNIYKEEEAPATAGEEQAPPKDAPQEKTAS